MLNHIKRNYLTWSQLIRVFLVLVIAVSYLFLIRPGRAWLSQQWVRPITEHYVDQKPDELFLTGSTTSVHFTVYILSDDAERDAHEVTFGFPFGFFLVIPLMLLLLIDHTNRYSYAHLIIQGILGAVMLLLYFAGLSLHINFLLLYNFMIDYLIPGAAFLIVLFPFIKDNKLLAGK